MERIETSNQGRGRDPVVEFLKDAHAAGFLSNELAASLYHYRMDQVATQAPQPARMPAPAPPDPEPQPAFRSIAQTATVVAQPSAAPRQPVPQPAPPPPPSKPASQPQPKLAPIVQPLLKPRRSRAEVWARFARMRTKKVWGTFTADFAANALTYLGVLLSIIVIYVFFAFGYFGEAIDEQHKQFRPLVEVGVVAFFLGLAWLLRHRSGIPQTSTAIEMIGIALVPIMISASFRDGCTPSYRPWCLPPDVDGPGRWAAYAIAGLISTGIYYCYARRRAIYAYLVGPMIWTSLGAFALYLEDGIPLLSRGDVVTLDKFTRDGISAAQLIAVLAAIGVSIAIASRVRHTRLGELLAVPTVRAGVFFTPFVLALSLVFSYNDTLSRGITTPNLTDLAWPNVIATGIAAVVFATAANATFAWENLGKRLRRDTSLVLQIAAYLSLASSWLLTAGFGVPPAWLGAGLVGYAFVIAWFDRLFTGPRVAAVWIVRTALAVAGSLSLLAPGATIAAWGTIGVVAILSSAFPIVAAEFNRFVPEPENDDERRVALALPLLVAAGAGAARMGWPDAAPIVLLAVGTAFMAAKLLPTRFADLRSFAGLPAVASGLGALGVEIWRQFEGIGFADYSLSGFLIALAILAALADLPTPVRGCAVIGFTGAAAMVAMRAYFGTGAWETAWIDTTVLAVFGLALVAMSLAGVRDMVISGAIGHVLVVGSMVRSLWFEETAILGLGVLAGAHIAEAVNIEMGRDGLIPRLARTNAFVLSLPTLVATTTLAPLTILIGRQAPFVADERPRFGPVLAVLSWVYASGVMQRIVRARHIAVPFAYAAGLAGIAVSAPSIMALLMTITSAAMVTAALAIRLRRPYASLLSWMLAVAAVLLGAYRAGVSGADLYLVLHSVAALLVLIPAWRSWVQRTAAGLASPWLVPPVYLGMLLLPVSLALSIADGGWIAWVAVSMAVSLVILGMATRAGGVAIPVAAALSIAYAATVDDSGWAHPFDQPLVWLPLAAAFIGIASLLPGNRRWRLLLDPAPGLAVSGLGVAAVSAVYSHPAGVLDIALVGCTVLLAAVAVIRREELWLVASGLTLVAAGLVAGDYWAPLATLAISAVTGFIADDKREAPVAPSLRAVTTIGLAATFALTGIWLNWTAAALVAIAGITGVFLVAAAVAATIATLLPRRMRVWTGPLHVAGHGLMITSFVAGVDELDGAVPFGLAALLVLLEAIATGVVGTVRRRDGMVAGSTGLIALSYALFGLAQDWTPTEVITYTAITGALLSIIAAAGLLISQLPGRVRLWLAPMLGIGQVAAGVVIAVAVQNLDPSVAAGISFGVLCFEAILVGAAGTIMRDRLLIAGSAVLAAGAYGAVPQWLLWTRLEFIGFTAILAVVFAIAATVVSETGRGRWALWTWSLHGLTLTAIGAIAAKTVAAIPGWQGLWILAALAFGVGCYIAANTAAAPTVWSLRSVAVLSFVGAAAFAIGGEVVRDGAVFAAMLFVAGVGVVVALAAGLLAGTERPWRLDIGLLSGGLLAIPVVAAAGVFGILGVEMGTLLIIAGAGLAAYGVLSHDLLVVEAAMVVWLGALMILVNERLELTLHAAVIIASVTLLATIELERHRRSSTEQTIPDGLQHLEWILMLAPLVLAVADMFESLWFGLALFTEGLLLTGWGALTEVRRRALLGVGAMVASIVLSVIIPALHGVSAGLTGGTWLVIGAVAATVFILAGSAIERRRHAIGRRLAHIAEILEHWE